MQATWAPVLVGVFLLCSSSPGQSVQQSEEGQAQELASPDLLATPAIKSCRFGASGDGCVLDLTAMADGTLTVCTKARRGTEQWRATIGQFRVGGAVSAVGSGSSADWTGCVSRHMVNGVRYEVLVNYERPLPGSFPTGVDLQITGSISFLNPAPRPQSGTGPETPQSCNVESIGCGALMTCSINPVGDTDTFTFVAPARSSVSINTARRNGPGTPCWRLFDRAGLIANWTCGIGTATLSTTASQTYTIEVAEAFNDQVVDYTLSMQGISQALTCGSQIGYGDLKAGKIEVIGDTDVLNFNGTQNQDVSINISRTAGAGTPCWRLFSPSGILVSSWACGEGTARLPETGKYSIEVSESFSDQLVDYNLSLQLVGRP